MGWLRKLVDWVDPPKKTIEQEMISDMHSARGDAKNRLRLVLMHDRTDRKSVV